MQSEFSLESLESKAPCISVASAPATSNRDTRGFFMVKFVLQTDRQTDRQTLGRTEWINEAPCRSLKNITAFFVWNFP